MKFFLSFFLSFLLEISAIGHASSDSTRPKISVICPTYNRPDKHANLYQAFAWQTYENKELLVLDDSPTPSSFFLQLQDDRVSYYHMPKRLSIGFKRNYLNEHSSGELIAHFDDDDYYAPTYLAEMVDQMGDADLIKLSRWVAYRELDGSLWEWDTNVLEDSHYQLSGNSTTNRLVNTASLFQDKEGVDQWKAANTWGYGFSYLYKKSVWKECPFEDVYGGEDLRFILKTKALKKTLRHIPDSKHLVIHTLHEKSTSIIFPQRQIPCTILEKNAEPWLTNVLSQKQKTQSN